MTWTGVFLCSQGDRGLYWRYYAHFAYLALNVEEMMVTGEPTYPVERVLLTSGVLEAAVSAALPAHLRAQALKQEAAAQLDSRYNGAGKPAPPHQEFCLDLQGERIATPWLTGGHCAYESYKKRPWRPYGPRPSGALITEPDDRPPPTITKL